MKFGFDLDGTLDRPALAALANILFDAGHEVHVITVSSLGQAGYHSTQEKKVQKLAKLGVRYTKLHLVQGGTYSECGAHKAKIVVEEGLALMLDDSPTFCEIMAGNTWAVILRVKEPNV